MANSSNDKAVKVVRDAAGDIIVAGDSDDGFNGFDMLTIKYSRTDGSVLWQRRYNYPAGGPVNDDHVKALAVDGHGDVVVTGSTYHYGEGDNWYTAKYAAADGAKLWGRGFNPYDASADSVMGSWDVASLNPQGGGDSHSLALGPNRTIAIAGATDGDSGPGAHYDYETILFREIPGPVSFAAWAAGFGLTGADTVAGADPDHDGMPNGVEYVLGGNPTSSATPAPPTAAISGGNMLFTFSSEDTSETEGVYPAVEFSTDLVTWRAFHLIGSSTDASTNGVTISENGDAPDTITVAIPVESGKAKFARLKVVVAQ
jgi:hypothetical protein